MEKTCEEKVHIETITTPSLKMHGISNADRPIPPSTNCAVGQCDGFNSVIDDTSGRHGDVTLEEERREEVECLSLEHKDAMCSIVYCIV